MPESNDLIQDKIDKRDTVVNSENSVVTSQDQLTTGLIKSSEGEQQKFSVQNEKQEDDSSNIQVHTETEIEKSLTIATDNSILPESQDSNNDSNNLLEKSDLKEKPPFHSI